MPESVASSSEKPVASKLAGPLRLTLVISSLEAGGAQRVMATLANHWAAKGWRLTLLTMVDGSESPFFPLHPQVQHVPLGLYAESGNWWHRLRNNLRRLRVLRREIADSRPQAVLSFMDRTNVLVLLATWLLAVPVVVSERIYPVDGIGSVWEALRRLLYPVAAGIVVLTERTAAVFPRSWRRKITVIPNPVLALGAKDGDGPAPKTGAFTVVAAGRLTEQKGFDLLIEAFGRLTGDFPAWNLLILGDGPKRSDLGSLCQRLGVAERVTFTGNVLQPETFLREADLFVLPSRFEGFPNVLCEAMACGLPVIAADCPTGPREIIRPEVDGLLVETENPEALARAMASLMADEPRRREMGRRATEITCRFGLHEVDMHWERLFAAVLERG